MIDLWRVIYHFPIMILFLSFRVVLIFLGYVMVPLGLLLDQTESRISAIHFPRVILTFKGLFWLWGNQEDGILAGDELKSWPNWVRILYWCVWRNPVSNLRFVPFLSCKLDPAKIKWVGTIKHPLLFDRTPPESEWFYSWQGPYAGLWIQWKMFGGVWRFWIGWKLFPADINGLSATSYRRYGAGFATQFKRLT